MATYWENSCSFGLRYVSWYKYLIVSLVFSHLGFWSGNLFLIAPFPDLCLLVPFYTLYDRLKDVLSDYSLSISVRQISDLLQRKSTNFSQPTSAQQFNTKSITLEPQQKYRLGTNSNIKSQGEGLNRFYRALTSTSVSSVIHIS